MKLNRVSSKNRFNENRVITNPEIYSRKREIIFDDGHKEEVKEFAHDGLFSPELFGKLDTENEYSCACGKFNGKMYEELYCEECNTYVEKVEANIDKTAWINLDGEYIIKYLAYMTLEKIIGRDELKEVVRAPSTINIEGDIDYVELEEIREKKPENKYFQLGVSDFKESFQEIIDYYFALKHPKLSDDYIKTLKEEIEELRGTIKSKNGTDVSEQEEKIIVLEKEISSILRNKARKMYESLEDIDNVFTDKIPVLSTVLRPAMRTADGLRMDALNNIYINILKSVKILHDKTNKSILSKIYTRSALQAQYFQLSEEIIDNIKGKGGLIRNQIMG